MAKDLTWPARLSYMVKEIAMEDTYNLVTDILTKKEQWDRP